MKGQKEEIFWNIVNSALAGILVLLGNFASGEITSRGICTAIVAALIVGITQFKNYWDSEKGEYSKRVFNFVNLT